MHYALVMVLRYTGARAKEIHSMRWSKLDLEKRYAEVVAEGGQVRVIYFKEEVAEALRRYRASLGANPPMRFSPLCGYQRLSCYGRAFFIRWYMSKLAIFQD